VPPSWSGFSIDYTFGGSSYSIEVLDPTGIAESGAGFQLDGKQVSSLELVDDGSDHHVIVSPKK
jgi:cellobiose phosphorylase